MIIVGIDPGQKGGVVVLNENGDVLHQFVLKKKDDKFDLEDFIDNIKNILLKWGDLSIIFVVEDVHSLFGMSAKSNFNFGKTCGMIEATICSLYGKVYTVTPKTWQKEMLKGIEVIKKPNSNKNDVKAMSLKAQLNLFPDFNSLASTRCKKPHDGLIDALLIAEYTRRKIMKGNIQ